MIVVFRKLIICIFLSVSAVVSAGEYGVFVKHAELEQQNRELMLNADFDFKFSEEAIEALNHGVPLTISVHLRVLMKRKYLWDKTVLDVKLPFSIHYHALVKLYQVLNQASGEFGNFATLESAIESLGIIRSIAIMTVDNLDKQQQYSAEVKVSLDTEALPLPLRPMAYISPKWHLSSSWYSWQLEN